MLHMLFRLVDCTVVMPVAAVVFETIERFVTVPVLTSEHAAVVIRKNSCGSCWVVRVWFCGCCELLTLPFAFLISVAIPLKCSYWCSQHRALSITSNCHQNKSNQIL